MNKAPAHPAAPPGHARLVDVEYYAPCSRSYFPVSGRYGPHSWQGHCGSWSSGCCSAGNCHQRRTPWGSGRVDPAPTRAHIHPVQRHTTTGGGRHQSGRRGLSHRRRREAAEEEVPHLTAPDRHEAKFRWPAEASDLFQEYDRRESERDFAYGISAPLAALSVTLIATESDWTWIALGVFIIAFFSQQAGYSHQRELERFVLEAVLTSSPP